MQSTAATISDRACARASRLGLESARVHASGAANLPVEALENTYPLRIERYLFRANSRGDGQMRGGVGVLRDYRVLADGIAVSLSSAPRCAPYRISPAAAKGFAAAFCSILGPMPNAGFRRPPSIWRWNAGICCGC
jgi:N-methylhydantoinase B